MTDRTRYGGGKDPFGPEGPDWDQMLRMCLYFIVAFCTANLFLYLWNGELPF